MWCLKCEDCVARKFKHRDESRWVLQKLEEGTEVGKILHPTQSHAKTSPSCPCALPPPLPTPVHKCISYQPTSSHGGIARG